MAARTARSRGARARAVRTAAPAAADDDLRDPVAAAEYPASLRQPPDERRGEVGGSADRHGPAELVAEHRHQPPERALPAASGIRSACSALPASSSAPGPWNFSSISGAPGQREARGRQQPGSAQPGGHRQARFYGRKGSEEARPAGAAQALPQCVPVRQARPPRARVPRAAPRSATARDSTGARPSVSGWASTCPAWVQPSPCRSRSRACIAGEPA